VFDEALPSRSCAADAVPHSRLKFSAEARIVMRFARGAGLDVSENDPGNTAWTSARGLCSLERAAGFDCAL